MSQSNATSNDSRRTIQEPKPTGDTGVHPNRTIVEQGTSRGAPVEPPLTSPGATMAVQTTGLGGDVTQPAAGTVLGTYRLVELLGEGGMGAVWKAVHTKLEKTVAVKLLPAHLTRDPAVVARFEREMKAVGKLDHPNIVRAMDAGEIHGTHFLVMEYVEGLDLGQVIQKRGPRSIKDSCEMVRQAAVGLDHAHQHKLVHRDIKPSNLLLSKQGKVKILDLGLARLQGDTSSPEKGRALTGFGMIMGTPDYMAPEQWEDLHTTDHRADLYALGCTLYYLLAGRAPFDDAAHASLAKKLAAHTSEPAPDLRKARPEVSAEVDAVYRKLMEKDPAARFASAGELAKALAAIAKGQPTGLAITESNPSIAAVNLGTAPTAVIPSIAAPAPAQPAATLPADSNLANVLSLIANETATAATQPLAPARKPAAVEKKKSPKGPDRRALWIAGGALAAVVVLGGIIIKITTRDGKTTEISVPNATKVEIIDDKPLVETSKPTQTPTAPNDKPPAANPAPPGKGPPLAVAPFDAKQARAHQEAWAKHLGLPVELTNSAGIKFVLIPPGEFAMGAPAAELGTVVAAAGKDEYWLNFARSEGPQHPVRLTKPIYLSVSEITQAQFEQLMGRNPSSFSAKGDNKASVAGQETASHPVEMVSWDEAVEFCRKLTAKELQNAAAGANGYRLPTEAEWEFAARAGTGTSRSTGDEEAGLESIAWYQKNSGARTHAAGGAKANPFGLVDMLGNVAEWCLDAWGPYAGDAKVVAVDPTGAGGDAPRVFRGGSWNDAAIRCRSAGRAAAGGDGRSAYVGFRIALPAEVARQLPGAAAAPGAGGPPLAVAPFDAPQARAHQEAWAKHLGVPVEFTNPVGMKFLLIPPGEYLQGTSVAEVDAQLKVDTTEPRGFYERERAQRRVRISKPFYLGAHEVTQGAWKAVLQTEPWKDQESAREGNEFPANHVSWNQCQDFCRKLSAAESGAYRLPTEAEWEYACRAGTTTAYSFGDQVSSLVDYAWYHGNAQNVGEEYAHEVGRKRPNPFGLFDMHGNLYELCQDYYSEYGPSGDTTIVDPKGPAQGADRVSRGAGWRSLALYVRSATRGWNADDERDRLLGFRVVMSVEAVQKLVKNLPRRGEVLHGGLVGRIQIDGKDAKVLATYASGKPFGQKNLKTILPLYDYAKQSIEIDLVGVLPLESAEKVRIRHAGGSGSGGVATLFVDDKPIGTVGDDHDKEITSELELAKGDHPIRWKLNGGWLGSANVIEVTGADGRTIALGHTEAMLAAARREETKKQADLTGEAAKPIGSTSTKPAGTTKEEDTSAAERRAAEWLRGQKVPFEIAIEGSGRRSGLDAPLPAGSFAVVQISFPPPREGLNDAAFENLAGLSKLESLGLPPGYTGEGLKQLAGMSTLKTLAIAGVSLKDEAMVSVGTFANLETLTAQGSLSQGNLTDKGFAPLASLKHLRRLHVHENEFTDAGLAHLAGMTELEDLVLSNHRRGIPKVTNAGMVHLRGMTKLKSLQLISSGITDDGLQHLAGMSELGFLSLSINRLTGEGLKHLPGKKLASLNLSWTDFNEAGLKEVSRFDKLTLLHIAGTPLKDESLLDVGKIKTLTSLDLNASPYRKATVDALQKLLPECKISADKAVAP